MANDLEKIDWVLPGRIAICDWTSAYDIDQVRRFGVMSILALSEGHPYILPDELGIEMQLNLRINDGPNEQYVFDNAVDLAEIFLNDHPPLLIRCRMGRSRSTAVTAALLMRIKKKEEGVILTVEEALKVICDIRPSANVHSGLMPNLRNFVP